MNLTMNLPCCPLMINVLIYNCFIFKKNTFMNFETERFFYKHSFLFKLKSRNVYIYKYILY